jgi:hypothetical protein
MSRAFWEKSFVKMHKDLLNKKCKIVHFAEIPARMARARPAQEGNYKNQIKIK